MLTHFLSLVSRDVIVRGNRCPLSAASGPLSLAARRGSIRVIKSAQTLRARDLDSGRPLDS